MKKLISIILKVVAVLLILAGGVWFLQGINILPGSFMAGDPQWAINGGIAVVVGAILFWLAARKK